MRDAHVRCVVRFSVTRLSAAAKFHSFVENWICRTDWANGKTDGNLKLASLNFGIGESSSKFGLNLKLGAWALKNCWFFNFFRQVFSVCVVNYNFTRRLALALLPFSGKRIRQFDHPPSWQRPFRQKLPPFDVGSFLSASALIPKFRSTLEKRKGLSKNADWIPFSVMIQHSN